MPDSTNLQQPFFGPADPVYPAIYEVLRVFASAVIGTNVYPSFVQQAGTTSLSLRDRVSAYVWEPNGIKLGPGYYDGRLVGSFNGLPLYVTNCCPTGGFSSSSSASGH